MHTRFTLYSILLLICCAYAAPISASTKKAVGKSVAKKSGPPPGPLLKAGANGKKAPSTGQLCSRANGRIQNALRGGLHTRIGSGQDGVVYALDENTVMKVLERSSLQKAHAEASNLNTVGQLIAWGVKTVGSQQTFYLMMPNMGDPLEIATTKKRLDPRAVPVLKNEALGRYRSVGMTHGDVHDDQWVYKQQNSGRWSAALIDWARASIERGHHIVDAGQPEHVC